MWNVFVLEQKKKRSRSLKLPVSRDRRGLVRLVPAWLQNLSVPRPTSRLEVQHFTRAACSRASWICLHILVWCYNNGRVKLLVVLKAFRFMEPEEKFQLVPEPAWNAGLLFWNPTLCFRFSVFYFRTTTVFWTCERFFGSEALTKLKPALLLLLLLTIDDGFNLYLTYIL